MTQLPTDIDATYPEREGEGPEHQRHHDIIHGFVNTHPTAVDPHGDRAYADGTFLPLAGGTIAGDLDVGGAISQAGAAGAPLNLLGVTTGGPGGGGTVVIAAGVAGIQAGTSVVATNASGVFSVTFPAAFVSKVVTVVVTSGDATAGSFAKAALTGWTETGFTAKAYTASGALITSVPTIRVNWIAVGA